MNYEEMTFITDVPHLFRFLLPHFAPNSWAEWNRNQNEENKPDLKLIFSKFMYIFYKYKMLFGKHRKGQLGNTWKYYKIQKVKTNLAQSSTKHVIVRNQATYKCLM